MRSENYEIKHIRLIRRWMAEDYVTNKTKCSTLEILQTSGMTSMYLHQCYFTHHSTFMSTKQ